MKDTIYRLKDEEILQIKGVGTVINIDARHYDHQFEPGDVVELQDQRYEVRSIERSWGLTDPPVLMPMMGLVVKPVMEGGVVRYE